MKFQQQVTKYCGKEEKLLLREQFLLFFHNIFSILLTSGVKLRIHLLNVVVRCIFTSVLQIIYVEVRLSRIILESPLDFKITSVHCIWNILFTSFLQSLHQFEGLEIGFSTMLTTVTLWANSAGDK